MSKVFPSALGQASSTTIPPLIVVGVKNIHHIHERLYEISSPQPGVVKELKVHRGLVSGADGADNSPVIKASQEKRTRH